MTTTKAKVSAAILSIFLVGFVSASSADELWKLVGQSNYVVTGIMDVPLKELAQAQRDGRDRYVSIPVKVSHCLKGQPCPVEMAVRYYSRPSSDSPSLEALASASGKRAILFLVQVDDPYANGLYFAGYSAQALQVYSKSIEAQVAKEVAAQSNIDTAISRLYDSKRDPYYAQVKELLDKTTSAATQKHAFEQLENLGMSGVPAMIMLMDDRRPLGEPSISLTNKFPGAFEGMRHYGPKLVIDAASALLNQITGESFGNVENGGSEGERTAAVRGWHAYLYHVLSARRPD